MLFVIAIAVLSRFTYFEKPNDLNYDISKEKEKTITEVDLRTNFAAPETIMLVNLINLAMKYSCLCIVGFNYVQRHRKHKLGNQIRQ